MSDPDFSTALGTQTLDPADIRTPEAQRAAIQAQLAGVEEAADHASAIVDLNEVRLAIATPSAPKEEQRLNEQRWIEQFERESRELTTPKEPSSELRRQELQSQLAAIAEIEARRSHETSAPKPPPPAPIKETSFWEGLANVASAGWELTKEIGSAIVDGMVAPFKLAKKAVVATANFLTDPDTWETAGKIISKAAESIWIVTKAVVTFAFDADTWKGAWSLTKTAWNALTSADTWRAVGGAFKGMWDVVTSKQLWSAIGSWCWDKLCAVGRFCADIVTNPARAWDTIYSVGSAVLGFGKSLCDSLGISDIAKGLWSLVKMPFVATWGIISTGANLGLDVLKVFSGQLTPQQLAQNFRANCKEAVLDTWGCIKGGFDAIKGGLTMALEITGIADFGRCILAFAAGNWKEGLMYLAFSAGFIASIVLTGGASLGAIALLRAGQLSLMGAAKHVLKAAAKEFFEIGAKELGQQTIAQLEKRIGKEQLHAAIEKAAVQSADKGIGILAEQGFENLSKESMQSAMREGTAEVVEKLLRNLKLDKIVEDLTYDMLVDLRKKSTRELTQQLQKTGLEKGAAKEAAQQIRRAIKYGASDAEIKQILEDGITKEVKSYLETHMEKPFKDRLRSHLRGEIPQSKELADVVKKQADQLGKSVDDLTEEYVEAGWKGAREGIEQSVRKVVREGIERAFDRFRKNNWIRLWGDEWTDAKANLLRVSVAGVKSETMELKPEEKAALEKAREESGIRTATITRESPDGQVVRINLRYNPESTQWEVLDTEVVKEANKAAPEPENKVLGVTPSNNQTDRPAPR